MLEVLLNPLAVNIVYVEIRDGQDTVPFLVAIGQLRVLGIEDAVEEGKIVGDLFVAIHVETILSLLDGGCKVGHVEYEMRYPSVEKDTRM